MHPREVKKIETDYKADNVSLRLRSQEFLAPVYLKDEIIKRINDLLSNMKTSKFKTVELFQAIAEKEIERISKTSGMAEAAIEGTGTPESNP